MRFFKQGLLSLFISLKSFFYLSYPLLQALCLLGFSVGLLMTISPSLAQGYSEEVMVLFSLTSLYLFLLKQYYTHVIAWADQRSSNVITVNFK
ncbi:hypothetical protein L4D77_10110 [Photobacterium frigidiphilum]|uniref:hypothetical protein n=1 Tax=Photobacterium frigidiphilum TaxID=264736 RepID=UPI003D098F23